MYTINVRNRNKENGLQNLYAIINFMLSITMRHDDNNIFVATISVIFFFLYINIYILSSISFCNTALLLYLMIFTHLEYKF